MYSKMPCSSREGDRLGHVLEHVRGHLVRQRQKPRGLCLGRHVLVRDGDVRPIALAVAQGKEAADDRDALSARVPVTSREPDRGRPNGLTQERSPRSVCETRPRDVLVAEHVVSGGRLLPEQLPIGRVARDRGPVGGEDQVRGRRFGEQAFHQRQRITDPAEPIAQTVGGLGDVFARFVTGTVGTHCGLTFVTGIALSRL